MKKVFYITTPIYYVNDQPHIGHAYTTIAADVLARWHRLQGDEVFFLTGTDEHGAKVAESAALAGLDPKTFADQTSAKFRSAFTKLNISFDHFLRTTDEAHERQVVQFLKKLQDRGAIYEGEYRGLYCTRCERFYTEKELVDGKCPDHHIAPETIAEKNHFFKLKDYLDEVERRIRTNKIRIEPETRRQETLGLFKQGLEDFSISREKVSWGIPFPGRPGQTVYVWVEALQNYITAVGYSDDPDRFARLWPHAVHLIGKDILKFHTIYWPALLLAAGEDPPKRLFAHGYFTINGVKMSKSLGNALDPNKLVSQYGADATRYLLLSQFPFGEDGDVAAERFSEKYNADLANGLGNLASRVVTMLQKFSGGEVPVPPSGAASVTITDQISVAATELNAALDSFAFERALHAIWRLIAVADGIVDREKPWELAKHNSEKLQQVLYDLAALLQHITLLLAPFLPKTTELLAGILGLGDLGEASRTPVPLPPGRALGPVTPLFPRRT